MQKTVNYQLNQWVKSDRIQMEDFNSDNAKIDTALKSNADGVAALQTALGEAHPTSLTFAEPPLLVFILGPESGFMARGRAMNAFQSSSNATPTTIWSADQKTVSWYTPYDAQYQLNTKDAVYQVLCFYQA